MEDIVTRFTIDLSDLEAGIRAKLKPLLDEYVKQVGTADKATDDLQATTGSLVNKLVLLAEAEKRAAEAAKLQAKSAGEDRQVFEALLVTTGKLTEERKRLANEIRVLDREHKALNKTVQESGVKSDELTKAIEENRKKHSELSQQLITVTGNEKLMKKEVLDASKAMIASAEAAKKAALAEIEAAKAFKLGGQAATAEAIAIRAAAAAKAKAALSAAISDQKFARSQARLAASGAASLGIFQRIGQSLRNFGAGIKSSFTSAFTSVRKGEGAFSTLQKGLNAANVAVPRLGGAFRLLTSPIGLVAGAIVGLFANLTRLDSVKVLLDGVGRGFGSLLDQLAGGTLTVNGFFDAFARGRQAAQDLNRLASLQARVVLSTAEEGKEIEKLLIQSKDRSKPFEEKVALLERVQDLEKSSVANQKAAADEAARINTGLFVEKLIEQNKLSEEQKATLRDITILRKEDLDTIEAMTKTSRGNLFLGEAAGEQIPLDVDSGARQAAIDASGKLIELQTSEQKVIESSQARINFLREQGAEERRAASEAELERQRKLLALADDIANARAGIEDIKIEVEDERIRAALSEVERAVFDSDKKFKAYEDRIKNLLAELRKLGVAVPQAEEDALLEPGERGRASAESGIRADFGAKEEKDAIDAQRRITAAISTEGERRLQAIRDDFAQQLADNDKFIKDLTKREKNKADLLLSLDEELADERRRQAEEAAKEDLQRIEEAVAILSDFVDGVIELQFRRNDEEAAAREERLSAIEDDFAAQLAANEQFDQSEQNRGRKRASILAEQDRALAAERARIAAEEQAAREEQSKAYIGLLLNTLEKVVQITVAEVLIKEIGSKGILGLATGPVLVALITALFSVAKGAIGAYKGDPYVQGPEGRDKVPYMLTRGERVVTRKDNEGHWELLEAMRKGDLDRFIHLKYILPAMDELEPLDAEKRLDQSVHLRYVMPNLRDLNIDKYMKLDPIVNINKYFEGEFGHRVASAQVPMKYSDRNIVEAQLGTRKELQTTNKLLSAQLEQTRRSRRHRHTWS